jgi:hypothetical protein
MTTSTPTRGPFRPTPAWLIFGLLVVEGLLWLSARFQWPTWHKGYAVLIAVASVGVLFAAMLLWLAIALVFRRRFQFTIRSLLVLTVAVALPCNWLAVELKAARREKAAATAIVKLCFHEVVWSQPSAPAWLRRLLGDEFFASVTEVDWGGEWGSDEGLENLKALNQLQRLDLGGGIVTDVGLENVERLDQLQTLDLMDLFHVTDAGLEHLQGLNHLVDLNLCNTRVTDAGLKHLKGLKQLQRLDLTLQDRVTDAGLESLKGLKQLQRLDLTGLVRVTDAGLENLKGLKQLQRLDLTCLFQVTDAGLENLKGLDQLQELKLEATKVTDEGVAKLQRTLPNCKIIH